jgi:hypothetical protein
MCTSRIRNSDQSSVNLGGSVSDQSQAPLAILRDPTGIHMSRIESMGDSDATGPVSKIRNWG